MTDEQGNSATMQGIRILQSWNCALEDCKVAKIIDIAMLRCWEKAGKRRHQGGESRPVRKGGKAPGRAQNLLAGCIFDRLACQKCFCVTFAESNKGYAPYPALITP